MEEKKEVVVKGQRWKQSYITWKQVKVSDRRKIVKVLEGRLPSV